jgi:LmbE family N-acetylglucosaminyl deacetylase
MTSTLMVVLAHPDDEVAAAGTLSAQRSRGDRVVVLWLTRGEMTEAFGPIPTEEVAERRERLGAEAARLLDVEHRFLRLPDTRLEPTPAAALEVARILCEVRPDGLLTWGTSWVRGARHPDHDATGKIARDAVTLARIAKAMAPLEPCRAWCPVFTYRDAHSTLPAVVVDVEPHLEKIREVAELYRRAQGFGDPAWLESRLRRAGRAHGLSYAEVFDAWESSAGRVDALLPAGPGDFDVHPDRAHRG